MNKTVLCIIDGLGINDETKGNAVHAANMTNLNTAIKRFQSTKLAASGHEVGLADPNDMGNSEVGHNAIGAGKRIKQGLALLNDSFASGEIFKTKTWQDLSMNAQMQNRKLNIIMLLSDGRTHSDIAHLHIVLKECKKHNIPVAIHALADGRDVAPKSVLGYIKELEDNLATLCGRGIAFMDRYESSPKILRTGFDLVVNGLGQSGLTVLEEYEKNPSMTDESLPPMVINPNLLIKNGDSVLLLNYRGDRAVQTCAMFESGKYLNEKEFSQINECIFAGLLQYDAELKIPKSYLCPPPKIENGLTWWLCKHNVKQLTVAETVKFGHITYFFNGNRALPFDKNLETWIEVPSHSVGTEFNKVPQMKAREITDIVLDNLDQFDFLKLNYSNPDMVGHTTDFDATVKACKVVDECIGKLINSCKEKNINLVITADHGNAEEMLLPDGSPRSSHTNNPVPLVIISPNNLKIKDGEFGLTNIAATICKLLDIPVYKDFNKALI